MENKKLAALTFDDGPNTDTTPLVLEMLKKYNIPATFFLIGNNINEHSAAVAASAVQQGCELENHSLSHPAMSDMDVDAIRAEIAATDEKITAICGRTPEFFRPPYIAVAPHMYDCIDKTFICGVGADDWDPKVTVGERVERILAQVGDGTIILLHDMSGNTQTVSALDEIIPAMQGDGYEFVTVSELFKRKGKTPVRGEMYSIVK
ncbi:MAG: polysaccharide deacetylase family protein [Eubacterium sp.]|nr:polysaccharide deacetylase family protein [Eubacterium sp.]